ncbi:MAG: RraA family protein [Clostridiales bacterium]|jgi:regulator of RNase E activity RraA|nr:RraA family protein [Clostridiales bacterium]
MKFYNRDDVIQLTPKWKGERFDDGRPRVSDNVVNRIAQTTTTEMWKPLYVRGYKYQFERGFLRSNPDKPVMCGRAVTAAFMPTRPDLHAYLLEFGHKDEGRKGNFNQWAIEDLVKDDVLIYDMKDKVYEGCPLGGNLTNVIASKTGQGAITFGGMRDLEQVQEIKSAQFYYRDNDPTPFMDTMLVGINVPCKIGAAVVLPGDIVLGTVSGVIFIPPHLAEICAIDAEKAHVRDIWGFEMVKQKKYTAAQMDSPWEVEMWENFIVWFGASKEADPYQHLKWEREIADARAGIVRRGMDEINAEEEEVMMTGLGQMSDSKNDPNQNTRW